MVKFSASGYDDGEGSINPTQKRRRVEEDNQSNQQPQQQSQEGFEMEYPPLGSQDQQQHSNHGNGETVGSSSNERGKNVSAIISDPDVLDCFICCEPLTVPVFQVSFYLLLFWLLFFLYQFCISSIIVFLCVNFCPFFIFIFCELILYRSCEGSVEGLLA